MLAAWRLQQKLCIPTLTFVDWTVIIIRACYQCRLESKIALHPQAVGSGVSSVRSLCAGQRQQGVQGERMAMFLMRRLALLVPVLMRSMYSFDNLHYFVLMKPVHPLGVRASRSPCDNAVVAALDGLRVAAGSGPIVALVCCDSSPQPYCATATS